jgi:hypothetical protein
MGHVLCAGIGQRLIDGAGMIEMVTVVGTAINAEGSIKLAAQLVVLIC